MTRPKLRFFELLTPLRHFLVYQYDLIKDLYRLFGRDGKKLGPTDVSKVSYGPKIAKIWSRDMPKFTFFAFLTPLRSFSVYPYYLEKDAYIFSRHCNKNCTNSSRLRLVMSKIIIKISQNPSKRLFL